MNVEAVKKLVRALNWPKLKTHLQAAPLTQDDVDNLLEVVYQSDSMVRRRPNDDGRARNEFLDALRTHLGDANYSEAVEEISHMRVEFTAIDAGYTVRRDLHADRNRQAQWHRAAGLSSPCA